MVMEKNMWEKVGEVFTPGPDPNRCSTNLSQLDGSLCMITLKV